MRAGAALGLSMAILAVTPAVATAAPAVTSGGGTASVQNKGTVHFALSARTGQGISGGASGMVMIRGSEETLRLTVLCMTTRDNFSFIGTQDPRTGLYYDVTVGDNDAEPDHFAYSGPYGDGICDGGIAQENSFVTSGNLVVHDG